MGVTFTYFVFAVALLIGPFQPPVAATAYVLFVTFVPHWLWRTTLPDPTFPFQKYIAVAGLAAFALNGFFGSTRCLTGRISMACGVGFLVLSWISALSSIAPVDSWRYMDLIWKMVLMTFLVARLLNDPKSLKVAAYLAVIAIGWNAYEINQLHYQRGFTLIQSFRWSFLDSNTYSLVQLLSAASAMAVGVCTKNNIIRFGAMVVAALTTNAIFILASRGAMLGLAASTTALLWLMPKSRQTLTVVGLAFLGGATLAGPSVVKEFSTIFADEEDRDASAESRFDLWSVGVSLTAENPALGVGPDAGKYAVAQRYPSAVGRRKSLHNLPLEISTSCGLPASLMYTAMFFLPMWTAARGARRRRKLAGDTVGCLQLMGCVALVGYWVGSLFNSGSLIEPAYTFLAITIAANELDYGDRLRGELSQVQVSP